MVKKNLKIGFLNDLRSGENTDYSLLALVPFVISGEIKLDFPESDRISMGTPLKYHFSDIMKRELENKYSFNKLYISELNTLNADYVIDGNLNKYSCARNLYFYGLSVFGPLLWYLAAPAFITSCEFDIEVNIRNEKNDILFTKRYVDKEEVWSGLYYNLVTLNKVHSILIKRFMQHLLQDTEIVFKK
ncbi:hypothetical protein EHO58_01455 [Leptospira selangorensis]|uniref:hypothetical protein n=1 Tax=Leptospira selangorensis TaxID=2484982 RepID=UPI001084582E|nr:hypothetical protein [Leptospira selangorensis]TGK10677.1 hypothetical protein EHO58_01455 [Leptospira selangorensis]